jgi:hypothetical protein
MEIEDALLQFSQGTGIYDFMNTPWGWPFMESLHFIGLSLLLGTVGLFDLRMLGFVQAIPLAALHKFIKFGVAGFVINATTGLMFVSSVPDQYLYNPSFQTKMAFLLMAGLNMLLFYAWGYRAAIKSDATLEAQRLGRVFALVSLICWLGVVTGGRLITFYRPPYFWCFWCG